MQGARFVTHLWWLLVLGIAAEIGASFQARAYVRAVGLVGVLACMLGVRRELTETS